MPMSHEHIQKNKPDAIHPHVLCRVTNIIVHTVTEGGKQHQKADLSEAELLMTLLRIFFLHLNEHMQSYDAL